MDPCEQHLIALRDELARRGVRCELDDRGIWPRLRIYCPGETPGAEFDNNVVTAPISGRWCYWWPSASPIGPVTRLTEAAETIIDELGIGDCEDGRTNVASLAVSRMLRQARMKISRPPAPGSAFAGPAAAHRRAADRVDPSAGLGEGLAAGPGVSAGPDRSGPRGGMRGGLLPVIAAELALAGFEIDVVDRWSDGRPAALAVTSPAAGTRAEITAHGTELELRCHGGPADGTDGLITAQVTAVLTAGAGDGTSSAPAVAAARQPEAGTGHRGVLLAHLRAELAGLGVRASPQPGGRSLGIWPGLYAGLSQDGDRYGWTAEGGIRTHPCGDVEGAARRIAECRDMLAGGARGWLA
jgi:hypothetical protein